MIVVPWIFESAETWPGIFRVAVKSGTETVKIVSTPLTTGAGYNLVCTACAVMFAKQYLLIIISIVQGDCVYQVSVLINLVSYGC